MNNNNELQTENLEIDSNNNSATFEMENVFEIALIR